MTLTALRRTPAFWLAVVAGLLAFCVQSGDTGTSDTAHRLQTTHSFWTSEPAVFPNEYPEFGVHGRGGKLYDWYGIGQPLLMLPADIVGTAISKLPVFDDYEGTDPTIRSIFVTYTTQILITVLTALVCYRFLLLLGFDVGQSVAGVLGLLLCTTHLHYTQNMMENNYILLLTLAGFRYQFEWLKTGKSRALVIGSAAFGLNLLTRLTTGLDLIFGGAFLLLALWFDKGTDRVGTGLQTRPLTRGSTTSGLWPKLRHSLITYLKVAFPIYAVFLFSDRLYQFYRFGSWTTTYVHYFTLEHRLQNPAVPANYPWETPFHVGFLGALITPEKSIFLFDPLIILTLLLAFIAWRKFSPPLKAYVATSLLLVLGYVCLYARYTIWSGDFAWGDRYVSTAAELAGFISVPLLLKFRAQLSRAVWAAGSCVIAASLVIQLASLAFWLSLEVYQVMDFGRPQWVVWLRMKNIVAFALGKMDAWGLMTEATKNDPWDYQHLTTWNFLPFVLRRVGVAPRWVVDAAFAVWGAGVAVFFLAIKQLGRMVDEYGRILP